MLIIILHSLGLFSALNDRLYDHYILLNQLQSKNIEIAIVSIDSKSINKLGDWPFKRSIIAKAVNNIIEQKPAVLGINLSFTEPKNPIEDNKLYNTLQSLKNTTIAAPLEIQEVKNKNQSKNNAIPVLISSVQSIFPLINHSHTYIRRSKNGTVSKLRPVISYNNKNYNAFSLDIIKLYFNNNKKDIPQKLSRLIKDSNEPYKNQNELLIDYRRQPQQFKHYPFLKVLNKEIPSDSLKDKIVLLGLTDPNLTGKYITPFAGTKALSSTPIELHAQIVDSFLNYRALKNCSEIYVYIISIFLAALYFYFFRKKTILIQGIAFISLITFISIADFSLFKYAALWLPPALPLILVTTLFTLSVYFTATNIDKEIINTINIYHTEQNLPFFKVPTDINSRVDTLKELLTGIANDRNAINAIIDGVNNGIIVFDITGKIIWANSKILNIYTESLILNKNIEDIINDLTIKDITDTINQNQIYKKEIKIDCLEFLCIINMIKTEKPQYVAILNDITELKQINRLKTDMVRMVSHELKNPLTAIQLSAENITFIEDRNTVIENADNIIETAELLRDTINNFLNLSKLESNMLKISLVESNLEEVIDKSIQLQKPVADKKNIKLVFNHKEIPSILMDKEQILVVMNNLISNAIKYSFEENQVIINTETNDNFITISVTDYGIGIPEDDVKKVFDKFFRSRNNKKGNIEGTGLGLSIVENIVSIHKGELNLKSEYEKGSCFSFTLPLSEHP